MRQLTVRAVAMGGLLGGVLSLTNLYVGLRSGWGFGVSITTCILSYAIWAVLQKVGLTRTPMTIVENNCMQSTGERHRLFHRQHPGLGVRRLYPAQRAGTVDIADTGLGVLHRAAGSDDGSADEAADDQRRTTALPTGTASAETLRALYFRAGQLRAFGNLTGMFRRGAPFATDPMQAIAIARRSPSVADAYTYPVAAGIIAGGSLMGVSIIVWENGPQLVRSLFAG